MGRRKRSLISRSPNRRTSEIPAAPRQAAPASSAAPLPGHEPSPLIAPPPGGKDPVDPPSLPPPTAAELAADPEAAAAPEATPQESGREAVEDPPVADPATGEAASEAPQPVVDAAAESTFRNPPAADGARPAPAPAESAAAPDAQPPRDGPVAGTENLPSEFAEKDDDWYLRTGQPAPSRFAGDTHEPAIERRAAGAMSTFLPAAVLIGVGLVLVLVLIVATLS